MKDFLEALVRVLRENFGVELDYPIPPALLLGVASLALIPTLFAAILWLRRHLGDARAISSEMHAAANLITTETRGEMTRLLGEFACLNDSLKSTVNERFDALHGFIKSTIQIGAVDDGERSGGRGMRMRCCAIARAHECLDALVCRACL